MKDENGDLQKVLAVAASSGLIGLAFGIARGIIQQKHGGWWGFFKGATASVVVAVIAGLAVHDGDLTSARQFALIGLLSYVADDVLDGVLLLSRVFKKDPIGFVRDVWSSIFGGRKS